MKEGYTFRNLVDLILKVEKRKTFFITHKELPILDSFGLVTNVKYGGIVLGKSHAEGGVTVLFRNQRNYRKYAEVEGYEYIMNHCATKEFHETLSIFNDKHLGSSNAIAPYKIPHKIRTLDATDITIGMATYPRFLVTEQPFIIMNRGATKEGLTHLDQLNEASIRYL